MKTEYEALILDLGKYNCAQYLNNGLSSKEFSRNCYEIRNLAQVLNGNTQSEKVKTAHNYLLKQNQNLQEIDMMLMKRMTN